MITTTPVTSQESQNAPVLQVQGLTTSFHTAQGWKAVARDITFDIHAGETLAIVGESGSGKSVTSLAIMGLLPKDTARATGSVRLAGRELLNLPEREIRKLRGADMAMVFQEPMTSLNPVYTVGDQIAEAIRAHRKMRKSDVRAEVVRLLDRVHIPNAAKRCDEYPHQMSGGMRQRVMLAMALASNPKVLIADEPTTALDVTIQREILELVAEIQHDTKMGVLFITHDMGVVAEIADRTFVMYDGDVVEQGDTATIFKAPQKDYTRRLLAAVPRLGDMRGKPAPEPFGSTLGAIAAPVKPTDPNRNILEVRDLSVHFHSGSKWFSRGRNTVHAVNNISFTLRAGETLSIVGESGSGKSSTGRAVLRLNEPTAGSIMIDGVDVRALKRGDLRKMRRKAQMIFQDFYSSLNPTMSIGEALAEPFLAHDLGSPVEASRKAADLLTRVGLSPDVMLRYPHEFSGGQRQRAAIARALMLDPELIVADEAVSALDVSVKAQVCDLLINLQKSLGLSYLFISHDMAIVERMSHHVAVMYRGEIVEIGTREEVLGNPQHAYTRRLLNAVPIPDPAQRGQHKPLEMAV